jgi:hypothetical protein
MSSEQADRFEASLRDAHARIDRRLNSVREQLDKEVTYSFTVHVATWHLLGLAKASDDIAQLRHEFELFKQGVL